MKSQSTETGFSDHDHVTYTILKSTFTKVSPKKVARREYKTSTKNNF